MRQVINLMKALSGEVRLSILDLLLERECCIYEVTQALGISQPRASHDLCRLFEAGILKRRREGTRVVYSVDMSFCPEIINAISGILKSLRAVEVGGDRLQKIVY